ncbi:DNA-binding protein Ikaros-like isoform X2 [Mya arenaria]|uniref:DNA-binding protein Ikaros-like isoform X2 n=1 Tax=Mya arenaria TaxID=6604 RepID=UPI0022E0FE1C|nr:DNA-binding protein Ikaros-like isoform X2 [Mya arenaria]XP_052813214.1 DNA-binding protein Ikaros-like isoform X2 [Mya arenaria]
MNDADLVSSAYAGYAGNLAGISAGESQGLIEQLQSLLKSNGVHGGRKMSTDQSMDTSNDRDDGVRPSCRFCGKTFAQASYIKAHERLHTGEKPYVCSVCNKAFSDASNWKKHERMHSRQIQGTFEDGIVSVVTSCPPTPEPLTPATPHSPTVVSAPGNQTSSSSVTMATMSFSPSPISGLMSPINIGMNSHLSTSFASGLSQLAAVSSGSPVLPSFSAESSQANNLLSQAPVFYHFFPGLNSSSLSQHSEDSNDLSPPAAKRNKDDSLSCNLCSKTFSTPASLSMHKKIHSGEKPHMCGTCGKSFTQIGTLRAHERVHTGEKPYECTICGKTFAQCGSFRMHERRHHRDMLENFQKCFICGASFGSLEDLQKHMMCHPGALNLNLPGLHPGHLGFPGPLPMGMGFPPDFDTMNSIKAEMKPDVSEMSEIERAFNLFTSQPKSAPVAVSIAEHFQLPPFASTAHALIQRSLSQGNDPNTAVSMLLASNGGDNLTGLNLLGQPFSRPGVFSPAKLPIMPPERPQSITVSEAFKEEVEPVSTTTRSRKYSSDSHTSMSLPDGQQNDGKEKGSNDDDNDNYNDGENDGPSQKMPSEGEESSLTESRSTEDFQSDDAQNNGISGGISRRNLNKRMITSSNMRKQRRPMRRLSTTAITDQTAYQQRYNENGEEINEEELTKDQLMVSFLLSKGEVYKCEHCHIIFEDCTLYLLHNGFHANDRDPFKCVICKKSCEGRVEFNCHLTSHIKS